MIKTILVIYYYSTPIITTAAVYIIMNSYLNNQNSKHRSSFSTKANRMSKQLKDNNKNYPNFNFFDNNQQQQNSITVLFDDLYPFFKLHSFTSLILLLTGTVQLFKLFVLDSSQLYHPSICTQFCQTFVYLNFILIYGSYLQFRSRYWFLSLFIMCQISAYLTAVLYSWSTNLHNYHLLTSSYSLYYLIINQSRFDIKIKVNMSLQSIITWISQLKFKTKEKDTNEINTSIKGNKSSMDNMMMADIFQSFSSQKSLFQNQKETFDKSSSLFNKSAFPTEISTINSSLNQDNFNYDSFFTFQDNLNANNLKTYKNLNLQKKNVKNSTFDNNFLFNANQLQYKNQDSLYLKSRQCSSLSTIDDDFISREKESSQNALVKVYKCIIYTFLIYCTTTKLQFLTFVISSVWITLVVQVLLNSKLRMVKIAFFATLIILIFFICF